MNIYEAIWKKSKLATALFITLTDRIALNLKNVNIFMKVIAWSFYLKCPGISNLTQLLAIVHWRPFSSTNLIKS